MGLDHGDPLGPGNSCIESLNRVLISYRSFAFCLLTTPIIVCGIDQIPQEALRLVPVGLAQGLVSRPHFHVVAQQIVLLLWDCVRLFYQNDADLLMFVDFLIFGTEHIQGSRLPTFPLPTIGSELLSGSVGGSHLSVPTVVPPPSRGE